MNILFVCTGNTCRSPMAEGYLNSLKIDGVKAISRGLAAGCEKISENSLKAMQEIGIDMAEHISKPLTPEDILWADKIYCMSEFHKAAILPFAPDKTELLGQGIPDPFGGDLEEYLACRDSIICEIDKLFKPFSVVSVEYRHIKRIAALERVSFSTPWSEEALLDAFSHGTKFFVAEKDDKVLGYIGISCILDEGYITNVAVFPEYKNKGVGTALLNRVISLKDELPLSFISLEVRESNATAIRLYEKFGFKTEGFRRNFYTNPLENALIMTKRF